MPTVLPQPIGDHRTALSSRDTERVKEQMIELWGPIIHEYYGATEGLCFVACNTAEWLAHRGTVGRVWLGELHILDERRKPVSVGTAGTLWFKTASEFEYFKDPVKTQRGALARWDYEHSGDDVGYVSEARCSQAFTGHTRCSASGRCASERSRSRPDHESRRP